MKKLVKQGGGMAGSKWTWGIDLTEDDLHALIRGADRQDQTSHTGYDQPHPSGSLASHDSDFLDPEDLEDPTDQDLRFDELSGPVTMIPDLHPHQFPMYLTVLLAPSGEELVDSEPDPVIEAFAKRAKAKAIKAKKLILQAEVDEHVSFMDDGLEFNPKIALVPRRPWLRPRLPIILPPTNIATTNKDRNDSDPHDEYPDHIDMPDSDDIPDTIHIPDSDDIPDHLVISDSDSSHSSPMQLPVSDDEGSDPMDVVREPTTGGNTNSESDSIADDIVDSGPNESPMVGIERDHNTGRFTAASFANFTDELLD